jgi:hypothetical protein
MKTKFLLHLAVLFCVALVVSNIIAVKLYAAPFGITLTAAVWLFPIVYIIGDVVPEVYGLATARKVIWLGFAANAFAVLFFMLTLSLPHPPYWVNQEAFQAVLGFTPRLLLASFVGYLIGTNANAWVLVRIKALTSGKWLWMRTIGSTIVGESLDSVCFVLIGFYGLMPIEALYGMVIAQAVFKTLYEAAVTPVTYMVVAWFKKEEGIV